MSRTRSDRIVVSDGSELARLLDLASKAPVLLEKGGAIFRLNVVDSFEDASDSYEPEAALAGMRTAAGTWASLNTEQLKRDIYRGREEGSRPASRP